MPMVSVIMSCYNHRKYVAEAIESVLAQTYSDFEFLIADDGSTDGAADVIRSYTDDRITFFEYDKNTAFAAWEEMNRIAKGKYVAYIASDDVWREDKLEKQVAFLEQNTEYEACFTWVETIDGESRIAEGKNSKNELFNTKQKSSEMWYKKLFLESNSLAAPSYMMKTDVFQQLEGFRFKYRQLQDYDLWLRYLLKHKLYVIQEKLTFYRWHANDGTANLSYLSNEAIISNWNESYHIFSEQIERIEDAFFVKAFEERLLNKACHTHEAVMCEKFFLMLNHPKQEAQQCAINYYLTHIDEESFRSCLEKNYGFSRADFYVMEVNRGIMTGMMTEMRELEKTTAQCIEMASTAIAYVEKLKNNQ